MNRHVLSYVRNKSILFLNSYRFIICVLVATFLTANAVFQLEYLQQWTDATILDAILYEFGLYSMFYLLIAPLCLFLVYNIEKPNDVDNYILIRIGRKNLFFAKLCSCIVLVLIYVIVLAFCSWIILMFNFDMSLHWGSYLTDTQGLSGALINPSLFSVPAILSVLLQFVLIFFCLCASGWLLILLMEVVKYKSTALILALMLNFACLITMKASYTLPSVFPQNHTFLSFIDITKGGRIVGRTIVYWLILMLLLYVLTAVVIQKKDYIYENASDTDT